MKTKKRFKIPTFTTRTTVMEKPAQEPLQRMDLTVRNIVIRAKTFNEEARTVEAVIATEARVKVFDFNTFRIIEEILLFDGIKLPKQIPLQDSHMRFNGLVDTIGSNRNLRVEGDEIVADIHFARTTSGENAFILYRDEDLDTFSVGYRIDTEKQITIKRGETGIISGKTFKASKDMDLRVVPGKAIELVENSAVAIPADSRAKTRNENIKPELEDRKMKYDADFVRSLGYDIESYSEADEKWCREQFAIALERHEGKETEKKEVPEKEEDQRSEPVSKEVPVVESKADLDEAVRKALAEADTVRSEIEGFADGMNLSKEVIRQALATKDVEKGKLILLEHERASRTAIEAPNIHVKDQTASAERLGLGLCLRAGLGQDELLSKRTLNQEAVTEETLDRSVQFSDMSMLDICRHALLIDGRQIPRDRNEIIRQAFSTISLPKAYGNIAQKFMLKGYSYSSSSWEPWTSQNDVADFKTNTKIRTTDIGDLELVNVDGEVADGSVAEEFETYNVAQFAKKMGVSGINIRNDDLNVLSDTPRKLGARAGQLVANKAYEALMDSVTLSDGIALFNSAHNNLNTTTPFSISGLTTGKTAFKKQVDIDGQTLDNIPVFLLAPIEIEDSVLAVVNSTLIVNGASGNNPNINVHINTVTPIFEPRLSNTNFENNSVEDWYLVGDPNVVDTVQVSFLSGTGRSPRLEQFDGGVNMIGLYWRVIMEVGAKALDFRGLQKNDAS